MRQRQPPTPAPALQSAAIYARYSTDRQDARSIDDQVRRCSEYAQRNGWAIQAVYADAAVSGAHTERPELQRLLDAAATSRGRAFQRVIVDDLSRLSRDLWDMGRIVFNDLAAFAVPVIDVMTNTSSDAPSARQLFAALGMGSDLFLQMVKAETHRGLEGRALAGFWTGGRVFGYRMVKEESPQDPEFPRMLPTIDPLEAAVVRKIYRLYAEGNGFCAIARQLNEEQIPAPYDRGGYRKPRGRGWQDSTIRALLENERYIGRWVWNKRKWLRVPGQKSKRSVLRPREEWIEQERSELAIVDRAAWDAVRKRRRERAALGRGRLPGDSRDARLLAGLLLCADCGSLLQVVGSKKKPDVRYRYLGCAARATRGEGICANSLSVSEQKAAAALAEAIGVRVGEPALVARFIERFKARVAIRRATPRTPEEEALNGQIAEREKRIRNFIEAIARGGYSAALAEHLKEDEAALAGLNARRNESSAAARRAGGAPTSEQLEALLRSPLRLLETNPVRSRTLLKKHFGRIVMTPSSKGARRYELSAGLGLQATISLTPMK
jgi:site-specific DNA recombinase